MDRLRVVVAMIIGGAAATATIFYLPLESGLTRSDVLTIHENNARALWLGADVANLCYENSDLMMRFSHYTDHHPPGAEIPFCPECTKDKKPVGGPAIFYNSDQPGLDLPPTSVVKDSREIMNDIGRSLSSLKIQNTTLKYTLRRLREKAGQ